MTATLTPDMRATLRKQLSEAAARMEAWDAPADKPRVRVPAKSRAENSSAELRSHDGRKTQDGPHGRRQCEQGGESPPASPLPGPVPGIATRAIDKPFRYGSYTEAKADIEARALVNGGDTVKGASPCDLPAVARARVTRELTRPVRSAMQGSRQALPAILQSPLYYAVLSALWAAWALAVVCMGRLA